ncbi:aldose 1-epimerase family protein [Leucobacter ruminantium]|uniref:Aldose 1-epimerase family protein n=1 Tax=Leucobacter ruminantium TaxID=1289170 RepID=A0A939RWS6_9MICO|nr:aldose 1-epimerase family protein [Leucobacter ruminantium]
MTEKTPISGEQFEISRGDQRAVIASVGASLREYTVDGRNLVVPFAADELRPNFRGTTVAPWPNRVVDGRFAWNGVTMQLALTEADRGHALHGFTPWLAFAAVEREASAVVLRGTVEPQSGYPWRIRIDTRYELTDRGLAQTVVATNLGDTDAPYGACPHPYLVAGEGPLDTWRLELPASRVLTVDEERLIPRGLESVEVDAARFDFRDPRPIGEARIDHAFTGLRRDAAGESRVELRAADGCGVAMVWGAGCDWLQIHTADLPGATRAENRLGLAVEPMTCAPDAFNAGMDVGLVVLPPGASHEVGWRIEPLAS